jgi:CheY-like chemotaxis protein
LADASRFPQFATVGVSARTQLGVLIGGGDDQVLELVEGGAARLDGAVSGHRELADRFEPWDASRMRSRTMLSPEPWLWPAPRVLVEHPDETAGMAFASGLRQAGYAVAVCPGPEHSERCPLAGPEDCTVAHGADVIVSSLGLERPEARGVLAALRARCADTPLIVEVTAGQQAEYESLLEGCDLVVSPVSPEQLVAAVKGALARQRKEL